MKSKLTCCKFKLYSEITECVECGIESQICMSTFTYINWLSKYDIVDWDLISAISEEPHSSL